MELKLLLERLGNPKTHLELKKIVEEYGEKGVFVFGVLKNLFLKKKFFF
jgi:hypothetical protein